MKKHYTMAEALEIMEFGEVMVKVDGMTEDNKGDNFQSHYIPQHGEACFFDETDNGFLKHYKTKQKPMLAKPLKKGNDDLYVIMDKKVYDKIQNG